MRKLLGGLVFGAGVAGLGYWGAKDHALDMQDQVRVGSLAALPNVTHQIATEVSGRDITVTGLANSDEERTQILAALNDVKGRRVVIDDLTVLETLSPYVTEGTRSSGGAVRLSGAVPTEDDRSALGDLSGTADLTLASGAPEGWTNAVGAGVAALGPLQTGRWRLEDTTLSLIGEAASQDDKMAAEAALAAVPDNFTVTSEIATVDSADDIDARIRAQAEPLAAETIHGVTATVAGQVITVEGIADTEEERTAILNAMRAVPENTQVIDNLRVLPKPDTYVTQGFKGDGGAIAVRGFAPTDAARTAITGANIQGLSLGSGAPDGWAQTVAKANAALAPLSDASWSLMGDTLVLKGQAATDAEKQAALAAVQPLPQGVVLDDQVRVLRDAAKITSDLQAKADRVAAGSVHAITPTVEGTEITLTGFVDSEAERLRMIAAMRDLPEQTQVIDQLEVLPRRTPYITTAIEDTDGTVTMLGSAPTDRARRALQAGDVSEMGLASGAPANWAQTVAIANRALEQVENGSWELRDRQLTFSGTVADPAARAAVTEALQALPDTVFLVPELQVLDDGRAVAFEIGYDAVRGAEIMGKLPYETTPLDLAEMLELPALQAPAGVRNAGVNRETRAPVSTALGALAEWMPSVETARVVWDKNRMSVVGVLSPGTNVDTVTQAVLAQDPDALLSLRVAQARDLPENGIERTNAATGQRQVFLGGFWVPVIDRFEPTLESCKLRADVLMAEANLTFVSGSSRLNSQSLNSLNDIAALLRVCVLEGGLRAVIGGHTDSIGAADANRRLSKRRAESVRSALVERGLPSQFVRAKGYGEDRPIADNTTELGRSQNRRTTIEWVEIP